MIRLGTKKYFIFGTAIFFVLFFCSSVNSAFAAQKYWIGSVMGSTTEMGRWSLTSGGAGGAAVPNRYDTVNYNSSGLGSSTVNANMTIQNLYVDPAYTGNIIVNNDINYIIGLPDVLPSLISITGYGRQIATTTTPVPNQNLGGAFLFTSTEGNATATSIRLKQAGSMATSSLSNVVVSFKDAVAGVCASTTPAGTSPFGSVLSFNASSTVTPTGILPLLSNMPVCLYVNYDLGEVFSTSTLGKSIDFEITNPATDITLTNGSTTATSKVNVPGSTMVVDDRTLPVPPDPNPNHNAASCSGALTSVLSLHMANPAKDPTVFYLQNCAIWKMEGGGKPRRLTNPNLQVHNLTFTDMSGNGSNGGIVRIQLTISNVSVDAPSSMLNVSRVYGTSAKVQTWGLGN